MLMGTRALCYRGGGLKLRASCISGLSAATSPGTLIANVILMCVCVCACVCVHVLNRVTQ